MDILRNGAIAEDRYTRIDDDQPLPDVGDVLLSLSRWLDERPTNHHGRVGVVVEGTDDVSVLESHLDDIPLIAFHFPKFTDGRCYSHAVTLRTVYGYDGDLRAFGDVLRDQIHLMARCGINEFVVREDKSLEDALKAFDTFTVSYQTWLVDGRGDVPEATRLVG